ncbi:MAG: sugar ABC transporter ATP-binding protein [Treponemataceae bacterium]
MSSEYVVELKNITKYFPGVVALNSMSIAIKPQEIHGLIGENGAGKSTLIKILTGVHQPDKGEILISGKSTRLKDPLQAHSAGIACVYQELNIVPMLSVTDNIFIGRAIKNKAGLLDYKKMHEETSRVLTILGHPEINPKTPCYKLGIGMQQMVEIAKAVLLEAKLIIMDEPTSSLGQQEIDQLIKTVRDLKEKGIAILFVSHKLEELFELCDRVTVIRDGEHIETKNTSEFTNESLIQSMVGRNLESLFPKEFGTKGEVFLKVENLNSIGVLDNINFEAHGGQIVSFAGLVGAGRTEVMRAIFGADPIDSGSFFIKGKKVKITEPRHAIKNKIAFLTEDRKGQGLVLSESVKTNLILANLNRFSKNFLLHKPSIENASKINIESLKIKTPSANEVVAQLSGGNQQKVVIGKWVNSDSEIFIFDEPTRGIDVGAKIEVYNVMNELVKNGKCVIMVSSELPEVLAMSDRVIVMREGKIMAEIERDSCYFNSESIMKAAWGGSLC